MPNVDVTQMFILVTLIAAATELIRRILAKDLEVALTIIVSGVIGALLGVRHYYNLDIISGVAAGLSASGTIKLLSKVGNGSIPAPSTIGSPR